MRKSSAMPVSVSPMLMRWFAFALACAVALGETRDCDAATFCVKTSAQFKSALGSSQGNGEDNTIYVKSGEYALNTDLGDGWEREGESRFYFHEFSEKKAYPLGINIVFYAMTH